MGEEARQHGPQGRKCGPNLTEIIDRCAIPKSIVSKRSLFSVALAGTDDCTHALFESPQLEAWQAAALLARRELSAVDLVRVCLGRIAEREPQVHAFEQLHADAALATARVLDVGPLRGLLHGLPFGLKDLFEGQYGFPVPGSITAYEPALPFTHGLHMLAYTCKLM